MTNASIYITHLIQVGWIKSLYTSTLAFNITQFFLLLNHQLLSRIMSKVGLDFQISNLFSSYLIDRQTQYIWNHFISSFFKASNISPYCSYFSHIWKKSKKILTPILVSILLFVDNRLFVSQKKSYEKSNINLL